MKLDLRLVARQSRQKSVYHVLWSSVVAVVCIISAVDTVQPRTCTAKDKQCGKDNNNFELVQLNAVEVGHVQNLTLTIGETHKMITKSLKPLLFEIPDFLSSDECDHIINLAEKQGLSDSRTLPNSEQEDKPIINDTIIEENCQDLQKFDKDKDGLVCQTEFIEFMEDFVGIGLREEDANMILKDTMLDANNDGFISFDECLTSDHVGFEKYVSKLEEENPLYRSRFSQQAWLTVTGSDDIVLKDLQRRITRLTHLPEKVIEDSEALQVVRYSVHGHYHAHYDSTDDRGRRLTCCNQGAQKIPYCHLCRFLTILYYLNDVPLGGETAFPVADEKTFNETEYEKKGLSNLSTHCKDANVIVKPKKGSAVMWYNHAIDPTTGLLGSMDVFSLHGGCDVLQGVKWIANNWINSEFG